MKSKEMQDKSYVVFVLGVYWVIFQGICCIWVGILVIVIIIIIIVCCLVQQLGFYCYGLSYICLFS